uniref:Uncharacterized protein n=1 Tax=Aegilops tauschii subsp. strangulata TaxID=200361 RepID=A0A453GZI3_AEGTS
PSRKVQLHLISLLENHGGLKLSKTSFLDNEKLSPSWYLRTFVAIFFFLSDSSQCLHARQEVFSVGNDTTATTLEWAITELVKNPKVMQKATAEVRQAFEACGTVAEHALGKLPYMHLVIRETLRLHTPVPLLLPRQCQEPCQVLGYDVPRGTHVLVNVWALAHDERYWHDPPDEFRPERFEGEAAVVDFRGTDFSFLPFGAGRRMCPGIGFGLANIELALASLLFHFDWEGPPPGEIDMAEEFGLTVRRKADLLLRPVLRVPSQ